MTDELPMVTVLVPTRPGQDEIQALSASRSLDYPPERLEVLVARGQQPAAQRNAALREARGDLIYFLDDDAVPSPGNLRRAVAHFRDSAVKVLGGPNLCPADAPFLEQVFAVTLGSWLAFGPSRARYEAVGQLRETSEKELILCNLLARRQDILELGGFDESLYPNEENALMDHLQQRGGKLLYDPQLIVHRRPRSTLRAFARMLLTYGRGRAEQFRLHPTFGSALNFAPPLFCLYVLAIAILYAAHSHLGPLVSAPLLFYAAALLVQTTINAARLGFLKSVCSTPLVVLTHILYGAGFWRGLFTRLRSSAIKPSAQVIVERATL